MTDVIRTETVAQPSLSLPVDPEHSGIRTVGCLSFILVAIAAFFLYSIIVPEASLLTVMLAVLTGAVVAYMADAWMKRYWPSGRQLVVDDAAIQVKQYDKVEMQVDPQRQVNVLPWRFTVKRNGRVKKGWYVVALGLEQDEMLLPVYTFAPPERFEELPLSSLFTALQKEEKKEASVTGSARELKAAGQQRRLHDAEKARSLLGAELTIEQFETYLRELQKQFPQWMPQK
jgi:hypothetical protein